MGWTFPWYSSWGSDFNYDFHATVDDRVAPVQVFYRTEAELAAAGMPYTQSLRGDWPGISTFLRAGGEAFHTYSTFGRGTEEFHNGNNYLDLTALGRQEAWEEPGAAPSPSACTSAAPACASPTNTTPEAAADAGAVWADQRGHVPGRDRQRALVQRPGAAVPLVQAAGLDDVHATPSVSPPVAPPRSPAPPGRS